MKLTIKQERLFTAEFIRRWVARHGTSDVKNADPEWRVGWSEMATWASDTLGVGEVSLTDRADFQLFINLAFRQLRRAYPDAGWRKHT